MGNGLCQIVKFFKKIDGLNKLDRQYARGQMNSRTEPIKVRSRCGRSHGNADLGGQQMLPGGLHDVPQALAPPPLNDVAFLQLQRLQGLQQAPSLYQEGVPSLVPTKLMQQFDSAPPIQAEDALDPASIQYGHFEMFQLRSDIGKSKQPFGFCRHSDESPHSSMMVHSCAEQAYF